MTTSDGARQLGGSGDLSGLVVGTKLVAATYPVRRSDLIRYAGASGDFNVIHWSERAARAAGLPDVIAHGMLTMALVARYLGEWCGDPTAIVDYRVRFQRPVVVPDTDEGVELMVSGQITDVTPDGVQVGLHARTHDGDVLSAAHAEVRLRRDGDHERRTV